MSEATTQESGRTYGRTLLILAVLLLAGVLVTNAYAIYAEGQQIAAQQQRAEEVEGRLEAQAHLISELLSNYQQNAYAPDVDRIAEQQLIATEYQLTVLQVIASQNLQIIELLADAP